MTRLTEDDFFTGLLAALALEGRRTLSIRDGLLDRALAAAFKRLETLAPGEQIDIRFRILPHPIHGDSSAVRYSISKAVQRDLISLDNPEYQNIRLKLDAEDARLILSTLPGGERLSSALAREFLRHYDRVAA